MLDHVFGIYEIKRLGRNFEALGRVEPDAGESRRRIQVGGQPAGSAVPSGSYLQTVRTGLGKVISKCRIELVLVFEFYGHSSVSVLSGYVYG